MAVESTLSYGAELKRLREKHKISQYELAKMAGVAPVVINRYENGQRGVSKDHFIELLGLLGYRLTEKIVRSTG